MPATRTYLDFNATAPLRPSARDRMIEVLGLTGNPSSIHAEGRAARSVLEEARGAVALLVGARPGGVIFTSGATEAAALALSPGLAGAAPCGVLLLSAAEHPAVALGHRFGEDVAVIPLAPSGLVDLEALDTLLDRAAQPVAVALQVANGETGVIQPVRAVADRVHARGGVLVADAAQAAGRIDCQMDALGADVLLLSSHKLGGPQGVGAAVLREGVRLGPPLVRGGGQERGARGGTENVAAIAGFGVAARMASDLADGLRLAGLRDGLERALRTAVPDLVVFGAQAPRLPNTLAFAVPGLDNATLLIALDLAGHAVSTGSACSSGKVSRSPVLEAMGIDRHVSAGMIRVSLGWATTEAHVARFAADFATTWKQVARRGLRSAA